MWRDFLARITSRNPSLNGLNVEVRLTGAEFLRCLKQAYRAGASDTESMIRAAEAFEKAGIHENRPFPDFLRTLFQ
jgi:hypothetical protein